MLTDRCDDVRIRVPYVRGNRKLIIDFGPFTSNANEIRLRGRRSCGGEREAAVFVISSSATAYYMSSLNV